MELSAAEDELARAEQGDQEAHPPRQRAQSTHRSADAACAPSAANPNSSWMRPRNGGEIWPQRLRARRTEEAEHALNKAREAVEVLQPLVIDSPPSGLATNRKVLTVDTLSFGYETGKPVLRDITLDMRGPERVALEGANGSGKSTLLACLIGQLHPVSGSVELHVPAALLDQDMRMFDHGETVRDAFARLDPAASENDRRAVLARFLFRGDDALKPVATLSGGQRLRAGLACTLGHSQPKQLLLLDEPSNHLDIEAVETLEAALNAYDGALLVVSHDEAFLERIGITRWLKL